MNLMERIKKDKNQFRKDGAKSQIGFATTLLSEIQRLEKCDQEDDAKVQNVIKKYAKSLDEMIDVIPDGEKQNLMLLEKYWLERYLPKQLTLIELDKVITALIDEVGAESPRDMGKVMKGLKEKFDGRYDGKSASTMVRTKLV